MGEEARIRDRTLRAGRSRANIARGLWADAGTSAERTGHRGSVDGALKIFISYRHEDSSSSALLLYDRLERRFGTDNVFLDVKTLKAGTQWFEEIKRHGAGGLVVLAVIGRHWLDSLKARQHRPAGEPEDVVMVELELALRRWSGTVIPVLVEGAEMPSETSLPKPIRALTRWEAVELRHGSFDQDVAGLIAQLEELEAKPSAAGASDAESSSAEPSEPARTSTGRSVRVPTAGGPDDAHYDTVLEAMVDEGTVVPVLGSQVCGTLPDAERLAEHLASEFKLELQSLDLAEVAQHVAVAKGPSFLYRAMNEALRLRQEPRPVHRFLAHFPKQLAELGEPPRYQMIVTTNYDTALERAFDDAGEEYDLAVFLGTGRDKGHFVHVPWREEPRLIREPSKYRDFPIDPWDELERTVIVKTLGAAVGAEGTFRWDRSYVLTEDQYIDYLVTDQISSVVPLQILNKLTSSHCLFLGYAMRDWSLRVFLKRIWQGGPLEDKSWAIERSPDPLEKDFWSALHVDLLAAPLDDYVGELEGRLTRWRARGA